MHEYPGDDAQNGSNVLVPSMSARIPNSEAFEGESVSLYGDLHRRQMERNVNTPRPLIDEEDPRWFWSFLKLAITTSVLTIGGLYGLDWIEHFFRH